MVNGLKAIVTSAELREMVVKARNRAVAMADKGIGLDPERKSYWRGQALLMGFVLEHIPEGQEYALSLKDLEDLGVG